MKATDTVPIRPVHYWGQTHYRSYPFSLQIPEREAYSVAVELAISEAERDPGDGFGVVAVLATERAQPIQRLYNIGTWAEPELVTEAQAVPYGNRISPERWLRVYYRVYRLQAHHHAKNVRAAAQHQTSFVLYESTSSFQFT